MKTIVLLLLCCLPAVAKTAPLFETAKVISQDLSTQERGYAAMPMGTGIMGVPIMRRSNIVVVETATQRITWVEAGRNTIILPVHGTIEFYRDGNWFVVLDAKNKKHKFGLLHLETITGDK